MKKIIFTTNLWLFIFYGLLVKPVLAGQTFTLLDDKTTILVLSQYSGQTFSKADYSYGPTIMNDNGINRMLWCGNIPGTFGDHILYSQSSDLTNWSTFQSVLQPTDTSTSLDNAHTCDPTMVKVGNEYYLYYTAVKKPDLNGTMNSVFLAKSTDSINWTKYPSNDSPQPVIPNRINTQNCYGTGGSSVIYHDDKFWQFYVDNNPIDGTTTNCLADAEYLATSIDGINWTRENSNKNVFLPTPGTGGPDVKYYPQLELFFMAYGNIASNKIFWSISKDGINWQPHDSNRMIDANPLALINHNIGIVGTTTGELINPGTIIYGSGDWSQSPPVPAYQWQLHKSIFNIVPVPAGDLNYSHQVDIFDYNYLAARYDQTGTTGFNPADINSDGWINFNDYRFLLRNFWEIK